MTPSEKRRQRHAKRRTQKQIEARASVPAERWGVYAEESARRRHAHEYRRSAVFAARGLVIA